MYTAQTVARPGKPSAGPGHSPGRSRHRLGLWGAFVGVLTLAMCMLAAPAGADTYVADGSLAGSTVCVPFGIAVDGSKLYVANYQDCSSAVNGSIGGLDLSTEPPTDLTKRGNDSFRGVAVDPLNHNVYGAAIGSASVHTFNASGAEVGSAFPAGGTILTAASDANGNVFVGEVGKIVEFEPDGTELQEITCSACSTGAFGYVTGLAFDSEGNLYVADGANHQVVKLEATAGSPTSFANPSVIVNSGTSSLDGPSVVAVDQTNDDVFVGIGCGTGFHVQAYDSSGALITEFGAGPEYHCGSGLADNPIAVDSSTGVVYVGNAEPGSPTGRIFKFVFLPSPTATTGVASDVTQTTATFSGTANPKGKATTDCHFEYGLTNGYGHQVPCSPDPEAADTDVTVHADVTGLPANSTIHFRLVESSEGGEAPGLDGTLQTLPNPVVVATGASSAVTQTTATISGTVNPSGAEGFCHFEYGTTASYGTSAPCATALGSSSVDVAEALSLSGLSAGTTYHYRLVGSNASGVVSGDDRTFTTTSATPPPPPPPPPAKPLRCKRGFKKVKKHGKAVCVKIKKRKHRHGHKHGH